MSKIVEIVHLNYLINSYLHSDKSLVHITPLKLYEVAIGPVTGRALQSYRSSVAGMHVSLGIVCPTHVSLGMRVSPHIRISLMHICSTSHNDICFQGILFSHHLHREANVAS